MVLDDYDFTRPKANLSAKLIANGTNADAQLEVYDYPGTYSDSEQGETYARVRLECAVPDCWMQLNPVHPEFRSTHPES